MRCFIALELPENVKELLAAAPRRLSPFFPGARWVRPESFHITLAFLGDIEGAAMECANQAARAAAGTGAFNLEFSGLLCLPEQGPGRVLALKAESGVQECALVHERVNRTLSRTAQERGLGALNPEWPNGRPFRVHITLARAGNRPFPRNSEDAWKKFGWDPQAPCRISRCILYRSELRPDGVRYEPLCAVEL